MSWELHKKKDNDLYRIYSTVADGYITKWDCEENIKAFWIGYKTQGVIAEVDEYFKHIDKLV